ncbi:putative carcinoembryonic antigen-related cell adhesion molecule 5-like [Scophthalmus maximus]|uniref:Putative carcinoembryonic antigen-related cell adhesion molecule 5-like n=1 Tax=Scophthalmus maximus TaxID=52904 RepID=A0A2U9AXM9_SCOMX|nr:putative carcinoembryonic antigen-related cell adhesion molecule 5-like [Scophthalmus maximus]
MDVLLLLCIVSVTFTGSSEGAGVLLDDVLHAAVGGKVMFTTLLTPQEASVVVAWTFGLDNLITSKKDSNTTAQQYEGRITLFRSNGSLELRNLTVNDSGEYEVAILPPNAGIIRGSTILEMHAPVLNVTVNPISTDLVEFSSSVNLSCTSSGSSLSFLWLNGSSEVTAGDRVQLTDGNSTVTIYNVTRYDQGPFRCHVFNLVSDGTSDRVNLSISFGPENTSLSPSLKFYEEGSNISLTCSAVSRPAAQVQWFLDGDELTDAGPELRLTDIRTSQSGNYSCRAFNNKTMRNQISQPAVISVLERISGASVKSKTNQAVEGNFVNLTCEAAGSVFTRQWMKDGSVLIPTDNMVFHNKQRVLSFQPLKKTDSGGYSCRVANPINSDEAKYTMVVNHGPDNVQVTGPSEINLKHTLTLTCSAESTPAASYTWVLNKKEILSNSAVFTKDTTEFSDNGKYICTAVNNITGRKSSAVHGLSVTVKPPSRCSGGCTAGIVVACCFVGGLCAGGWFFISRRKKQTKDTRAGEEGKNSAASSGSQEVTHAQNSLFQNKDGGTVELGLDHNLSDNAEVKVNNTLPAASSPPTGDVHQEQM